MIDEEEYEDDGPEPVEIPLGSKTMPGLYAWVSEEDRDLARHNWTLKSARKGRMATYYALRKERFGGMVIEIYLHNEVWERDSGAEVPRGFLVDHIDRDKLNNCRSNLRLATKEDNERNKGKRRTQKNQPNGMTSSRYKGVNRVKGRNKPWRAIITFEKRQIFLGSFYDEKDAAKAYNKAALEMFQEFAVINVFDEEEA